MKDPFRLYQKKPHALFPGDNEDEGVGMDFVFEREHDCRYVTASWYRRNILPRTMLVNTARLGIYRHGIFWCCCVDYMVYKMWTTAIDVRKGVGEGGYRINGADNFTLWAGNEWPVGRGHCIGEQASRRLRSGSGGEGASNDSHRNLIHDVCLIMRGPEVV